MLDIWQKKMGLPINKLIVATNKNDILKRVISTGVYKPKEVFQTISPSMDIQVASNFERLIFYISGNNDQITFKIMEDLKKVEPILCWLPGKQVCPATYRALERQRSGSF